MVNSTGTCPHVQVSFFNPCFLPQQTADFERGLLRRIKSNPASESQSQVRGCVPQLTQCVVPRTAMRVTQRDSSNGSGAGPRADNQGFLHHVLPRPLVQAERALQAALLLVPMQGHLLGHTWHLTAGSKLAQASITSLPPSPTRSPTLGNIFL